MLCALACVLLYGNGSLARETSLTVLAAASLEKPLTEIETAFEKSHPEVAVEISYAGSQQLASQLSLGAPGDLFLSADRAQMDVVIKAKRTGGRDVKAFAGNSLCLLVANSAKNRIKVLADLTQPGVRLCLAGERVPVGAYTVEMLKKAGKKYGPTWADQVRQRVVSFESNVTAVATRVDLGEVDAGIVYETDARQVRSAVGYVIPKEFNVKALYYLAPIKDSPNRELANRFASLVMSKDGQAVLAKYGFSSPK